MPTPSQPFLHIYFSRKVEPTKTSNFAGHPRIVRQNTSRNSLYESSWQEGFTGATTAEKAILTAMNSTGKMVQRERSTATEKKFVTGLNSIDKMDEEVQLASKELNELKEGAALAVIHGFDPMKKKKKKKQKDRVREDLNDEPIENEAEHLEIPSPSSTIENGLDSSFPSPKKIRNEHADGELEEGNLDPTSETNGGKVTEKEDDSVADAIVLEPRLPWEGLDRDYKYEELLGRVLSILREKNPELAGEKRRTIMRPPQVLREGTKKTVFVNFMDLCKTMHRQPEHATAFLLAELGTSGSLDGQQRLVVRGRFAPKNFEGILRRYVNEYVMCNWCKSSDTTLTKENRLFFLHCEQCGSSRSVAQIKAGFVAKVGRRKAAAT